MNPLPAQIETDEGKILVRADERDSLLTLEIHLRDSKVPTCRRTALPLEVIHYLVDRLGCARVDGFVKRQEDPDEIATMIPRQLLSYFTEEDFGGRRLLDFGCGFGHSSVIMAKLLPNTEIVGVDLSPDRIEIAAHVAALLRLPNVKYFCSPAATELPAQLGRFDFVMLCGVFEHLLPRERRSVMPLIWSAMKPGASLFVNETPHRYFPYEHHSTGLWLINYMPDRLAHRMARKFANSDASKVGDPAINASPDWETHLRGGLRGGTEWEIIRDLTGGRTEEARILQPCASGLRDRADYWLRRTGSDRHRALKRLISHVFRITDRLLGTIPSTNIDVVIRKQTS